MEPAIRAVGLSKSFRLGGERRTSLKEWLARGRAPKHQTFWALKDASFAVPRGSSMGLIGQNGSGKSTALKVLAGIYRPTSGRVEVNGRVSALLEVGAGFHPELTGRENIRLNATILGFSGKQINSMMDQIIEFADIGEFIDSPIKHYSSGMYVRLGFAVAVMVKPDILIVDEVIAVGDEEFQRRCFDHLHQLRLRGTTMVIVSHGMGLITDLCDEAVWLEHGRVQEVGSVRGVTAAYMDRVNQREAERAAAEAGPEAHHDDQPPLIARLGSGEVRIERVELLDASGAPSRVVISGEPMRVRMHYRATQAVPDAVFGIGFKHESGVFTAGPNSGRLGGWDLVEGIGYVDFDVESLALLPGTFTIQTAVVDRGHTYDFSDNQATLKVRSAGETEPGLMRMDGAWSISRHGSFARSGNNPRSAG
jgi:homopolymeric O-antigen transport system ATP-binding protein